ncbi:B-cell scaffold protein with ankyrin repeats-like isoform X1 [Hypomesus transpacificus]|uniref:B-cell scaffold protein with ankyrin repeats-like isoform X1 n=1 Tax=Hypomesus transpacificus TaxID=137520 RepID=UPI001F07E9F4|nr:B-cell scaffold protein with ankyrin repeats-like isoform X1 [Hypomesus transpacificus]XP_046904780.1 B-cell scaffold protein with ankyrin repeats-like isoform X1 [Hypomesus transpacificus]XP_046904781.1 B-cell scaffold protein with ankyrin repeats-like isoform X1 [Hypomesus transpacificus]XP_046904782.1 B-cell scaffold protein with ankyrin repeats-like isoform X1 [Hypomesus transpacificus]
MSYTAEELLIIYEAEAEQWATYLRSIFTGPIQEGGICCYDIGAVSSRRVDFLCLVGYKCKLLILSKGMLENMCRLRRFLLARLLCPAASVVVLLCGVDSLAPLLELVPLKGGECLQISSEQDVQEYLSAVTEIVYRGAPSPEVNPSPATPGRFPGTEPTLLRRQSSKAPSVTNNIVVVPSRVACGGPGEVFILLKDSVLNNDVEVEFLGRSRRVTVKAVLWNDLTLCVTAADFPVGCVDITVYCGTLAIGKTHLQYYSTMEEIGHLLAKVADPVDFMCQALQVSSGEMLDQRLSSILVERMPSRGFQGLQPDGTPETETHQEIPSLLHFAAKNGFKDVCSVLLQCPGAKTALHTPNSHGQTPLELAQSEGHAELHILLKETLNLITDEDNEESGVYEHMQRRTARAQREEPGDLDEDEEDPYALLGINDEEYDTILAPSHNMVIANRPPAPTPRPETTPTKEDLTPFIAQVFQKKMSQSDSETLYSYPTKQVSFYPCVSRGEDNISCTYDTFVPSHPPGLEQLIELQEKVKRGSLTMDEALEQFSDWQRVQKGMDAIQQQKLRQLRASIINNREDDQSIYDKISIIHHTPDVKECRRGSQPVETEFYSKPLKGQNSNLLWKADKR